MGVSPPHRPDTELVRTVGQCPSALSQPSAPSTRCWSGGDLSRLPRPWSSEPSLQALAFLWHIAIIWSPFQPFILWSFELSKQDASHPPLVTSQAEAVGPKGGSLTGSACLASAWWLRSLGPLDVASPPLFYGAGGEVDSHRSAQLPKVRVVPKVERVGWPTDFWTQIFPTFSPVDWWGFWGFFFFFEHEAIEYPSCHPLKNWWPWNVNFPLFCFFPTWSLHWLD